MRKKTQQQQQRKNWKIENRSTQQSLVQLCAMRTNQNDIAYEYNWFLISNSNSGKIHSIIKIFMEIEIKATT